MKPKQREAEGDGMHGRKPLTQIIFCWSGAFLLLPSQDFVKAISAQTACLRQELNTVLEDIKCS